MSAVIGLLWYCLMGYVVWRAFPAIRADLRSLRAHAPTRRGRYRGGVL